MLKTQPFATTSGDYLSVLLSFWLPRYGWTVVVPVLVCATLGFAVDERLLLVALMLVFIVVPMVMSFLYTYYMLTPEARRAVLRKEVEIVEGKHIRLVYLPDEKADEDATNRQNRMMLKSREAMPSELKLPKSAIPEPEMILWSDVKEVKYTSRFIVYLLNGARLNFLLIPHQALQN